MKVYWWDDVSGSLGELEIPNHKVEKSSPVEKLKIANDEIDAFSEDNETTIEKSEDLGAGVWMATVSFFDQRFVSYVYISATGEDELAKRVAEANLKEWVLI